MSAAFERGMNPLHVDVVCHKGLESRCVARYIGQNQKNQSDPKNNQPTNQTTKQPTIQTTKQQTTQTKSNWQASATISKRSKLQLIMVIFESYIQLGSSIKMEVFLVRTKYLQQ